MARQTIELLIDDLDGSRLEDGEGDTVTFAYQGAEYSIDLSQKHLDEFHDALAKYIAAAQRSAADPAGPPRQRAPPEVRPNLTRTNSAPSAPGPANTATPSVTAAASARKSSTPTTQRSSRDLRKQ